MNLDAIMNMDFQRIMRLNDQELTSLDSTQLRSILYGLKQCRLAAEKRLDDLSEEMETIEDFIGRIAQAEERLSAHISQHSRSGRSRSRPSRRGRTSTDSNADENPS